MADETRTSARVVIVSFIYVIHDVVSLSLSFSLHNSLTIGFSIDDYKNYKRDGEALCVMRP